VATAVSTDTTYDVTTADIGKTIVLVVTASNTAGSVSVETTPTSVVSDWVDIVGETSDSLVVTEAMIGRELRFRVRATNIIGQASAYSAATDFVSEPVVIPPPPPAKDPSDDIALIQERFDERGLI
jgi:hypothetical protein